MPGGINVQWRGVSSCCWQWLASSCRAEHVVLNHLLNSGKQWGKTTRNSDESHTLKIWGLFRGLGKGKESGGSGGLGCDFPSLFSPQLDRRLDWRELWHGRSWESWVLSRNIHKSSMGSCYIATHQPEMLAETGLLFQLQGLFQPSSATRRKPPGKAVLLGCAGLERAIQPQENPTFFQGNPREPILEIQSCSALSHASIVINIYRKGTYRKAVPSSKS